MEEGDGMEMPVWQIVAHRKLHVIEAMMKRGFDPNLPSDLWLSGSGKKGWASSRVGSILVEALDRHSLLPEEDATFLLELIRICRFDRSNASLGLRFILRARRRPRFYEEKRARLGRLMITRLDASLPASHPLDATCQFFLDLIADRNRYRATLRVLYGIARFRRSPCVPYRDSMLLIAQALLPLPE